MAPGRLGPQPHPAVQGGNRDRGWGSQKAPTLCVLRVPSFPFPSLFLTTHAGHTLAYLAAPSTVSTPGPSLPLQTPGPVLMELFFRTPSGPPELCSLVSGVPSAPRTVYWVFGFFSHHLTYRFKFPFSQLFFFSQLLKQFF